MSPETPIRAYLIFTGSGPILALSTYPELTDHGWWTSSATRGSTSSSPTRSTWRRWRGATSTPSAASSRISKRTEDIRVLDFNGHQIMANFSLDELGEPIKYGG